MGLTFLENCLAVSTKAKDNHTCLRHAYIRSPKDMSRDIHSSTIQIAQNWKQLKCPSKIELSFLKMQFIYTVDVIRMEELQLYTTEQISQHNPQLKKPDTKTDTV